MQPLEPVYVTLDLPNLGLGVIKMRPHVVQPSVEPLVLRAGAFLAHYLHQSIVPVLVSIIVPMHLVEGLLVDILAP
jgi:hypothetical protein